MIVLIIIAVWILSSLPVAIEQWKEFKAPDPTYGDEPEAIPGKIGDLFGIVLAFVFGPIGLVLYLIPNKWFGM